MSILDLLLPLLLSGALVTILALGRLGLVKAAFVFPAILAGLSVFVLAYSAFDLGRVDSLIASSVLTIGLGGAVASLATGLLAGGFWLRYQRRP